MFFLFLVCFLQLAAATRFDPLVTKGKCANQLWNLQSSQVRLLQPVNPEGRWTSVECEIHPGPTFLTRQYEFLSENDFQLTKYFYADADCRRPLYAVQIQGRLKTSEEFSWSVPGSTEFEHRISTATFIAYDPRVSKLHYKLAKVCTKQSRIGIYEPLKIYKRKLVGSDFEFIEFESASKKSLGKYERTCLDHFNISSSELNIMRREIHRGERENFQQLLFIGLSRVDSQTGHRLRASSFQPALHKDTNMFCNSICHRIRSANLLKPPRLFSKSSQSLHQRLTFPRLEGTFVSSQCESQPNGVYALRRISFSAKSRRWTKRMRLFDDPWCRKPAMTIISRGKYALGSVVPQLGGQTRQIIYRVNKLKLMPESTTVLSTLRHFKSRCGVSSAWQLRRAVDLTKRGGCPAYGLSVPSSTPDVIRLDSRTLRMGDVAHAQKGAFPTSFASPMGECDISPSISISVKMEAKAGAQSLLINILITVIPLLLLL